MILDNERECQDENSTGLNQESYECDIAALKTAIKQVYVRVLCRHVYERIPLELSRFARRTHVVAWPELVDLLDEAVEQGRIAEKEAEDANLIDAVARGRRRSDNVNTYFAVEISTVIDQHDLERAVRRAAVIARAVTLPTMPIVVGEEILPATRTHAEVLNAGWVIVSGDG